MNDYRGKHSSEIPWAMSSTATSGYRSRHMRRNRRRRNLVIALIVVLIFLLVLPFVSARVLRTDRVNLTSENLPVDIGHLRVVYLSDIHYGFFFSDSRVNSLVSAINSLKPDIVLFGGDIGDTPEDAVAFFRKLPSIHTRYAMLGVLGEHDHGEDDPTRASVCEAMRNAGVTPLVNEVVPVRVGTSTIYVAGLDDASVGRPDLSALSTSVSAEDYVIFMSHNPSVIPDAHRAEDRSGRLGWFDLALFGHTHGGQLRPFTRLLDIAGDVDDHYLRGWLVENRADLLISDGVGTSVIPARLFCPPQIHCIDISLP